MLSDFTLHIGDLRCRVFECKDEVVVPSRGHDGTSDLLSE